MTTSSLPYNFKEAYGEATLASIGVAGTVVSTGDLHVSGKAIVSGSMDIGTTLEVDGSVAINNNTDILGRVRVGTSASDLGNVVLCRTVRISGNNSKQVIAVPQGSDITDIVLFTQTAPEASAGSQVDIMVGTSGHDRRFASFTNVSAQGVRVNAIPTQTSAWNGVSGANCIINVSCTAISGAIASAAQGKLHIMYVKPQ